MPKMTKAPGGQINKRHNPLAEEYIPQQTFKWKTAKRRKHDDEDNEEHFVDTKASRKILQIGRELAEQDENENQVPRPAPANTAFDFSTRLGEDELDEEPVAQYEDEEEWGDEEEVVEVDMEVRMGTFSQTTQY